MSNYQHYMKVYVNTISKRLVTLKHLYSIKSKIDSRLLSGQVEEGDIKKLIYILGKDSLFRSAESRDKQSLRHYTFKVLKSIKNLVHFSSKIKDDLDSKMMDSRMAWDHFSEKEFRNHLKDFEVLEDISKKNLSFMKQLDKVFKEEVHVLLDMEKNNSLDIKNYLDLLSKECGIIVELNKFSSNMSSKVKNVSNFLKTFSSRINTLEFKVFAAGTLTALSLCLISSFIPGDIFVFEFRDKSVMDIATERMVSSVKYSVDVVKFSLADLVGISSFVISVTSSFVGLSYFSSVVHDFMKKTI